MPILIPHRIPKLTDLDYFCSPESVRTPSDQDDLPLGRQASHQHDLSLERAFLPILCSNVPLQIYLHIGQVCKIGIVPKGDCTKDADMELLGQGPGLDFVQAVLGRTSIMPLEDGMLVSSIEDGAQGRANQHLVNDFIDLHPYFLCSPGQAETGDIFRDKMAFYLVKRGAMQDMVARDVVASAACLVAESIVRLCKRRARELCLPASGVVVHADVHCAYIHSIVKHIRGSLPAIDIQMDE